MVDLPKQYDNRNDSADCQLVIASAGAIDGAPSQENPCKIPLRNIDTLDLNVEIFIFDRLSDSFSLLLLSVLFMILFLFSSISLRNSKFSLIPIAPITNKLNPTAASVYLLNFCNTTNCVLILPFKKNAHSPMNIAETPCPRPQVAPSCNPYHPDFPTLGGSSAARWSGPEIACKPPDKSPPIIDGLRHPVIDDIDIDTIAIN